MIVNSKFENLMALNAVLEGSETLDGVLLIVSGVTIVGKLNIQTKEISEPKSLYETTLFWKNRITKRYEDIEWIGDGAVVGISDAMVKYPDGNTLFSNEIVVLVSEIDVFTAVNIENYLKQSSK